MASDVGGADEGRLSRRTALKSLGAAGTGLAWTAPTILSTPAASAATIVPHPCTSADCGPDDCDDQGDCGSTPTQTPCSCTQNFPSGNGCTCTQNVPCSGLQPCQSQADCGVGFACQVGCCGTPLCFPLCA